MLDGPKRGTDTLSAGTLEYRKLKDLNETTHAEGTVIRAAEFHPHAAVALVAGLNGAASLFKVDGRSNPKIQTVNFQNFPIRTAHFSSSGHQFFAGSQHFPHYFVYDLNAGKTLKVEIDFFKWLMYECGCKYVTMSRVFLTLFRQLVTTTGRQIELDHFQA